MNATSIFTIIIIIIASVIVSSLSSVKLNRIV